VSGKGQVGGDGFPRQEATIRRYAAASGLRVVRWFREEGVSGTKELDQRPALQSLVVALHANGIKTVIVERLDRLARDLMIQETIIGDLRKSSFDLISVAELDLCSDDPSRKLVRQVFGAIAEYERCMIVQKLRGARERIRADTGRCEGRKPYGTRPGEREVIARMRQLRLEGATLARVAETLSQERVRPRTGRRFYPANIARILARTDKGNSKGKVNVGS
jgi:DNA invertase Pin-like site-specific DNA recombinase